eukprot:2542539-Prymnesium_polylepis.1
MIALTQRHEAHRSHHRHTKWLRMLIDLVKQQERLHAQDFGLLDMLDHAVVHAVPAEAEAHIGHVVAALEGPAVLDDTCGKHEARTRGKDSRQGLAAKARGNWAFAW